MKKLILPIFFLLHACLTGQVLPFKTFNTADGLLHDQITAMTEDQRGLLWVGTPYGINWFDGKRFYSPPLEAQTGQLYITDFYNDPDGSVWILTFYNGIYHYNGKEFVNYLPRPDLLAATSNNVFGMIRYDQKRYLVATDETLYWFDGVHFSPFVTMDPEVKGPFNFITKLQDGSLLVGVDRGVWHYKLLTTGFAPPVRAFSDTAVTDALIEGERLWLATEKGVYQFTNSGEFPDDPFQRYLKGQKTGLLNPGKGAMWVVSDKAYKLQNGTEEAYGAINGLPTPISQIYTDSQDNIWFASSKGLSRLSHDWYLFYDLRDTNIHSMTICMETDTLNNLWLGSYDGLSKKTPDGYDRFRYIKGEKLGYISWILRTTHGTLLTGTEAGILEIREDQLLKRASLVSTRAFEDVNGIIWLGTVDGLLYKLENDSLKKVSLARTIPDYIDAVYVDRKGYLWMGYRSFGILKLKQDRTQWQVTKEYSAATGFPDVRVRCGTPDEAGNILFGTRTNGLFVFSVDTDTYWHVDAGSGLNGNWVKSISRGRGDTVFLATNRGAYSLSAKGYDDPKLHKLDLSIRDMKEETNFVLNHADTLWIATNEGVLRYHTQRVPRDTMTPPVYFTQVRINGRNDATLSPYTPHPKGLQLAYDQHVIEFEFSGIDKKNGDLLYSYRLEGQDTDWTSPSQRNYVSYNLPPDSYTFKVKAITRDGVESREPATINFSIALPFWKTPWFMALLIGSVFLILFAFYNYRLQQLKSTQKLRSRISTDLHDDIGSTLSSIAILSEMALTETQDGQTGSMVREIRENARVIMDKMDDIVWSINPRNDSLEDLLVRIKRFAALLFEAKNIRYSIAIGEIVNTKNLSMEYRQHIYLILKEAIINLAKYSDCSEVAIRILSHHGILDVEISDNGKGFDTSGKFSGNGLLNMQARASRIGAELIITSEKDQGTMISLRSKII